MAVQRTAKQIENQIEKLKKELNKVKKDESIENLKSKVGKLVFEFAKEKYTDEKNFEDLDIKEIENHMMNQIKKSKQTPNEVQQINDANEFANVKSIFNSYGVEYSENALKSVLTFYAQHHQLQQ